jgi:hypothetical protein
MQITKRFRSVMFSVGVAVGVAATLVQISACGEARPAASSTNEDLGGVVTSTKGPEAGVWVIAETTDLATKFVKMAITDDRGQYLVPDLPTATYNVWVRGYGLVDSPKVQATPGQNLNLTAVIAPSPHAAAQYYPAGFWFSLMRMPDKNEFPGTGPSGNGISPTVKSQAEWIRMLKSGNCTACHQLGTKGTREIPAALGAFVPGSSDLHARLQERGIDTLIISGTVTQVCCDCIPPSTTVSTHLHVESAFVQVARKISNEKFSAAVPTRRNFDKWGSDQSNVHGCWRLRSL